MRLDIRLPIGLLFAVFGAILTVFGLVGDPARYEQSLGVNINLYWGLVLFVFGTVMILLGRRGARASSKSGEADSSRSPRHD
jgi:hypothetical protein